MDAILLASAGPRRACLPAARAPRDNDDREAPTAVRRLLLSRGGAAAGTGATAAVGVTESHRSFVTAAAGAPRPFRGDGDVAEAGEGTGCVAFGGVDEQNDFWRNTPGEQDGSTSGEIFLKRKNTNMRSP